MSNLHFFFFAIYPYICLAIFFFGSLVRFDREQYTWKSDSSQLLYDGQLRLGNILLAYWPCSAATLSACSPRCGYGMPWA